MQTSNLGYILKIAAIFKKIKIYLKIAPWRPYCKMGDLKIKKF